MKPIEVDGELAGVMNDIYRKAWDNNHHPRKWIFHSSHEFLGVVTEEFNELIEAVRSNEPTDVRLEIIDIAAACACFLAQQNIIERIRMKKVKKELAKAEGKQHADQA